ncbi:MAG: UDP-N-acetylmuramate dehydrogenase [Deltaproteobacteria bacterium]|nr:UDP-N-acetylmuramate dehydrogenase [Deltaproteobacteria bacterium]NCP96385.1 UDP-N-acetylmuramate dehydrogenase [Deltaproteobacteria bacterium]NCS72791.1 UDP-N-acetylmuramate dehydrogenase [Deltaproteobacteria bacterium]OIP66715.1 MAG: UDP-N-acetylenolpyruvoylglucosamine reductase [Nitrospirae bacterium CG2_30_70_394]HBB40418.1 UDP-N-acetylenolpyruvoylglucosamine reductase [Pseudomonadota bacterium]
MVAATASPPAALLGLLDAEVRMNEPMAAHTTFGIGGPAQVWVRPRTVAAFCGLLVGWEGELTVVGRGSNLLVRDGGIRGVVVDLHHLDSYRRDGDTVVAGGGLALGRLVRRLGEEGRGGMEELAGIPGSVGAAVRMNAGAHGREIRELLVEARVANRAGALAWRPAAELGLAYRSSRLAADEWVVEARFVARPAAPGACARQGALLQERRAAQPVSLPSAGSIFKNPVGRSAWRLIRDAGLAGERCGGAQISPQHANFIVNTGGATAAEVETLIARAREQVQARSGVALETEVVILGVGRALSSGACRSRLESGSGPVRGG